MEYMVRFSDVNFSYNKKKKTLNNVTFNIEKGSFHGLIGQNGSGKSTIIKLLIGALINTSGDIFINDNLNKDKQSKISYFPDLAIFPSGISTLDYLKNEVMSSKGPDPFIKEKIVKWLTEFDLMDAINRNPNHLSMGQKKKIELIRIILEDSDLIILDEPTNYLDHYSRNLFFKTLKWFNKKGTTIIISSHILNELKLFVDSATIIHHGNVKFNGKVSKTNLIKLYDSFTETKINGFENE